MQFSTRVIQSSRKVHKCLLCCRDIPKDSIYVSSPCKGSDGKVESIKLCTECAYLLHFTTKTTLDEGNFSDMRIPNFLRKIRAEYRKDPKAAWDRQNEKEDKEANS